MEAKDTVMNETLIQTWCLEFVQPGELDLNAKLKEFALAQTEISFPAGQTAERKRIIESLKKTKHCWKNEDEKERIILALEDN